MIHRHVKAGHMTFAAGIHARLRVGAHLMLRSFSVDAPSVGYALQTIAPCPADFTFGRLKLPPPRERRNDAAAPSNISVSAVITTIRADQSKTFAELPCLVPCRPKPSPSRQPSSAPLAMSSPHRLRPCARHPTPRRRIAMAARKQPYIVVQCKAMKRLQRI